MSFLNPWALLVGGIAFGLPFAVHFLTKPRPQPLPLSTIHFVYEAISQRRSRHRLRDWLVLLLRCLAIAMIAAAIARPLWRQSVIATESSDTSVARVVIVDLSQSMAAGRSGNQPIARAIPITQKYLTEGGAKELSAALVTASSRAQSVYEDLSTNLTVLRRRASQLSAVPETADAESAFLLAAQLLGDASEDARREVVVISDFQRSDWGAMPLETLPRDVHVQLESVGLDSSSNLAITGVSANGNAVAGQPMVLTVEARNDSGASRTLDCKLDVAGQALTQRRTLPIGRSSFNLRFDVVDGSPQGGTIELLDPQMGILGDDLPEDDFATFAIAPVSPPSVLLISDENPQRVPSSSYYIERASQQLFSRKQFQRVSPGKVDQERLRLADVILIDHPGRLATDVINRLVDRMKRGAGALYFAAEPADAVNLEAISRKAGAAMELPVRYLPPRGGRPRRDLAIDSLSRREAPFDVFGDAIDGAVEDLRLGGGLRTEPTEESLADRVLATLEDQSALLVTASCGGGRFAVLNSDLQRSNLPVRPAFVPLLGELTRVLMPTVDTTAQSVCGQSLVRLLPKSVGPEDELVLKPASDWPQVESGYGSIEVSGPGMVWSWSRPSQRGLYGAYKDGECVAQIATNIAPGESDLTILDPEEFELNPTEQSERRVAFRDATESNDDEDYWWNVLLGLCVVGLFAELVALAGFRH
ncbi:MAG: BatA and WFA domain-containing protein [Planctomycetota bacterium]